MKNISITSIAAIVVVSIVALISLQNSNWPLTFTRATSIETSTPSASLGRDYDLLESFKSLMLAQDEDCTLPCWWNLKPGVTTIDETIVFLNQTEFDRHWKDSIYSDISLEKYIRGEALPLYFLEDSYFGEFIISFGFDTDDRINSIRVVFNDPSSWLSTAANKISVSGILSQISETPEIYVAENPSTFRLSEYNLILLYRNQGVEIRYIFDLSDDNPQRPLHPVEHLKLCLDNERTQSIEMSLGGASSDLQEKDYPEHFKTPENAFGIGISTEEFVEFFRENPDECLDVSEYKAEQ